jgi:DNA-binding GntR family transcriptional regulator
MPDEAYDSLKKSIVDGIFRPGERLRALRLANDLKISRTPVKEALARLEQEGLVRREQGAGYIVRGLSVSEILNLYRVREVLEVEVAREAVPKMTAAALKAMREALDYADTLLASESYADFLRANRKFHDLITAQTGNSVLQEVLANLGGRFWSIGTIVVSRHSQRVHDIRRENRAILDALATGDIKVVEEAVRAHVRGAANAVRFFIERETQQLFIVAA